MFSRRLSRLAASFAACLVMLLSLGTHAAEQTPPTAAPPPRPAQRPEELKALDGLIGVWNVDVTATTIGDTPEAKVVEQKGKGVETMQWVLDNSFVAGHSTGESGKTLSAWMWGYDQTTKTYHLWWFGAGGQVTVWTGAYDPSNKTFTVRTQAAGGFKSEATIQIIDENNRKQTVQVRDPNGKATQRIVATMTRRK